MMVAYSFQKRFIGHITAGLEYGPWLPGMKRHTLRDPRTGRSQHARPEQELQLYTAMRTKQCRLIGRAVCRLQMPVTLTWFCGSFGIMRGAGAAPRSYVMQLAPIVRDLLEAPPATLIDGEAMDSFARTDGFADRFEMAAFFEVPKVPEAHLQMVLIGWAPIQ